MKRLTREILEKILDNTEQMIDNNNFDKFYRYMYSLQDDILISEMSEFLLDSGINPLDYMTFVPYDYLSGCENVIDVHIPSNVNRILDRAFTGSSIKEVSMDNVKKIGKGAFYSCSNLTSVKLSSGLEEIDDLAFADCPNLDSLEIPSSIKKLGVNIIYKCPKCKPVFLGTQEQWDAVEKDGDLKEVDALYRKIQING